jgi:uncharacterized protein YecT (DUF1311 family)
LAILANKSQAASFDCAKAQLPAEKFVCGNAFISKLDDQLDAVYKLVLDKASAEEKQQITAQQKDWLNHVRNRNHCMTEVCFKHAYWSRHADLAFFLKSKLAQYESPLVNPPMCSSQWLFELGGVYACGNPSNEKCYNMIEIVRKALNEQLKRVTSKLNDPDAFIQAHRAWKRYGDLECEALVPQCPYGHSGSCSIPSAICETYLNCKQIDHLRYIEDNSINSYNKRITP